MSRCFPFPPPGYERKIKADDPRLLKKEKYREKNQKKEKKDKEKKGSKEKREKERTDEKRRETKDKKEKHRDKNESDLDKDNKGNGLYPDEKKPVGSPKYHLHKLQENNKYRENEGSVVLGEKRISSVSDYNNGEFNNAEAVSKHHRLVSHTKVFKNTSGLGRRNIDEETRANNPLPNKYISVEKNKDGVVEIAGTCAIPVMEGKEKTVEKAAVGKKMDLMGIHGETKLSRNELGQNVTGAVKFPDNSSRAMVDGRERKEKQAFGGMVQNRVGAMGRPVEKKPEIMLEEKEKVREKRNDEDREKTIHKVKGMDMEKKKKKEENVKATSDQKRHVHIPNKRDSGEYRMLAPNARNESKKDLPAPLSDGIQTTQNISSLDSATLLGKRKDIGLNGIYDEHMTEPNKLARTTVSTPPLIENGRSLESCRNSAALAARPPMNIKVERTFAPDGIQRPPTNIKVEGNAPKISDTKTAQITQSSQTMISKSKRKSEVSAKLHPHPDTKYLTQVLTVPKLNEWPEFDDQEWLLRSNSSQTSNPLIETSEIEEEPTKVWASALLLNQVDIFALPYVIPY